MYFITLKSPGRFFFLKSEISRELAPFHILKDEKSKHTNKYIKNCLKERLGMSR